MEVVNDWVGFTPEHSQLARVKGAKPSAGPPAWVALTAIAAALGLSLSLALPPATTVKNGEVTARKAKPPEAVAATDSR